VIIGSGERMTAISMHWCENKKGIRRFVFED